VSNYALFKSVTPNFADAVFVATLTKTEYIVSTVNDVTEYYFVAPANTNGMGAISEGLRVRLLAV